MGGRNSGAPGSTEDYGVWKTNVKSVVLPLSLLVPRREEKSPLKDLQGSCETKTRVTDTTTVNRRDSTVHSEPLCRYESCFSLETLIPVL